jgi:hypothetical protein
LIIVTILKLRETLILLGRGYHAQLLFALF